MAWKLANRRRKASSFCHAGNSKASKRSAGCVGPSSKLCVRQQYPRGSRECAVHWQDNGSGVDLAERLRGVKTDLGGGNGQLLEGCRWVRVFPRWPSVLAVLACSMVLRPYAAHSELLRTRGKR